MVREVRVDLTAETLAEYAGDRLREDIVAGVLAPALPLKFEELKARYEVGISPLREALARLVGEGLVTQRSNRGFRVATLSEDDLADIAFMRTALETHAMAAAIAQGDENWEAEIVASLHRFVRITERTGTDPASLNAWQTAHDDFHAKLIAACGSPRALHQQALLAMQHARYRRFLMGDNLPRALLIAEHDALAKAALARNAERACALLAEHMKLTSNFYAGVLRGDETIKPKGGPTA